MLYLNTIPKKEWKFQSGECKKILNGGLITC